MSNLDKLEWLLEKNLIQQALNFVYDKTPKSDQERMFKIECLRKAYNQAQKELKETRYGEIAKEIFLNIQK